MSQISRSQECVAAVGMLGLSSSERKGAHGLLFGRPWRGCGRAAVESAGPLDGDRHALEEGEVAHLVGAKLDPVRQVLAHPAGGHG